MANNCPIELYDNKKNHKSNEFLKKKAEAEKAMSLGTNKLIIPLILKGDKTATNKWRELVKLYKGFDFVTSADSDILTQYCLCCSEINDLVIAKKAAEKFMIKEFKDKDASEYLIYQEIEKSKIDHTINKKRDALIKLGGIIFLNPTSRIRAVAQPKTKKEDPVKKAGFNI